MNRSTSVTTAGIFGNLDVAAPVRSCPARRLDTVVIWLLIFLMPQIAAADGKIYWDRGFSINRASLDGSGVAALPVDSHHGVAVDVANDRLFYTYFANGNYNLAYTNLDGTDVPTVVTWRPYPNLIASIALDVAGGKVYWSESGSCRIQRTDLSGGPPELLVSGGSACSSSLELDLRPSERKMYYGTDGNIYRNNLEGTAEETVVHLGTHTLGLAVDTANDQIYVVGATQSRQGSRTWVKRVDFDGTNVVGIFDAYVAPSGLDIAIDVHAGVVYWTWKSFSGYGQVYSVAVSGGTPTRLVTESAACGGIDIAPCIDGPDSPVGVDVSEGTSCAETAVHTKSS